MEKESLTIEKELFEKVDLGTVTQQCLIPNPTRLKTNSIEEVITNKIRYKVQAIIYKI